MSLQDNSDFELVKNAASAASKSLRRTDDTWEEIPVSPSVFFEKFLHEPCYPEQQKFVEAMLGTDPLIWDATYDEGIALVGKGGGKDRTICKVFLYCVYKLLCMRNPQKMLGINNNSEDAPESAIDLANVSLNARLAKDVFFKNLIAMIRVCRNPKTKKNWFEEHGLDLKADIQTREIKFPKAITAYSLDSEEYTGEGLNILLAIFDEVGGFDPGKADKLYTALVSTQKTRFGSNRKTMLISYKRDDNDFMMIRYQQAEKEAKTFRVKAPTWVWNVKRTKADFADDYLKSPEDAKRIYECEGSTAAEGYFKYKSRIKDIINPNRVSPVEGDAIWTNDILKLKFKDFFRPIKNQPYFIHIDLAKGKESGDYSGIAMGHFTRNKSINLSDDYIKELTKAEGLSTANISTQKQPAAVIDFMMQVRARPGQEIIFDEFRQFIQGLYKSGFNIKMVTYDGWQCTLGSNKVKLLNGNDLRIDELTKETWIYSYDLKAGCIVPALCKPVRKTGTKVPVYRVTLDSGETVEFTPDHPILMRDGTYRQVQFLQPGDSLMPLYTKYVKPYKRKDGSVRQYEQIYNAETKTWDFTHNVVAATCYGPKPKDFVVHHKDFNPLNNSPENLVYIHVKKHVALHKALSEKRWAIPGERKRQAQLMAERNKKFNLPALLKPPDAANAKKISASIKKLWQDPVYAKKMSDAHKGNPGYWTGKKRSQETKDKISKTKCGANNHKVVSVEFAGYEDVYDIEVPATHNFALSAGIFVHNSVDSVQLLIKQGIPAEVQSVDRSTEAYDTLKEQIYKGLLDIYHHPVFIRECEELIRKPNGKVDHPEMSYRRSLEEGRKEGSKDLADAVAAVVNLCIKNAKAQFSAGVAGTTRLANSNGFRRPDDDEKSHLTFYGKKV
jgi:hypothetical protein